MRRACKVTLKFATETKRRQIAALLEAYRAAVNFYIRSLWETPGKLDKATLGRLMDTRLSERLKSQALKQALEIVKGTRKSAKALGTKARCPVFRGSAVLDAKIISVEVGRGSFDLVIRLSCLKKGERLVIPTKRTAVLNHWQGMEGARLIQGCALSETGIVLWIELPDLESKTEGVRLGVDIGVNKLLSDSEGRHYGTEFKAIRDKINRRQPGSRRRTQAHTERKVFINRVVKALPWPTLAVIGVESLKNLKRGKSKKRGKKFRKAMAPWTYRHVLTRISELAQVNRVQLVRVDPANTSRACPQCGTVHKDNRKGENFLCRHCGHTADADTVGAQNILARTLATFGSLESPEPQRDVGQSV